MLTLREYIHTEMTDADMRQCMKNHDDFERQGQIGECALRHHSEQYMKINADMFHGMTHEIVRVMRELVSEIWRHYARSSPGDSGTMMLSSSEMETLCRRLEHDASWDKVGDIYYRMKDCLDREDDDE